MAQDESGAPAMEEARLRAEMAAALRWSARLGMNEAVANHFSVALDDGRVLINPRGRHFATLRASDLLVIDPNDPGEMERPDAPDPTAWGLHGALHRACPHARCAMHLHPVHATVLACLEDPALPPIDQTAASFFGKVAIDTAYGGLALGAEAERACALLADPEKTVLLMGNHGVMAVGRTVAETFDRLYYFERAAETYVKALWTGMPLRILSDEVATLTARQIADDPTPGAAHMAEIRRILDAEEPDYAA